MTKQKAERDDKQPQLFVPDRFDMLQRRAPSQLDSIVVPVEAGLRHIKTLMADASAAGRGAFLLLRGESGSGKSTFLYTLGLFLKDVEVLAIPSYQEISVALRGTGPTKAGMRAIVIEGRDALRLVGRRDLEDAVHGINTFIRTARGERTVIVWPVNTDDLEALLVDVCASVGGDSLLRVGAPTFRFTGPDRALYLDIAETTVATLNEGASLADLGVSHERAAELAGQANTIGGFLGLLRQDLLNNLTHVETLLERERCRLWIVVASTNDPEGDISGLTRGPFSAADIERLLGATEANVVKELKRFPEKLGILGAVLDAKVLLLPSVTALAIAREFHDESLASQMAHHGLSVAGKKDAVDRVQKSDIGRAFSDASMGPRTRGCKPGSNTEDAFRKLAAIAVSHDGLLNAALGRCLRTAGLIDDFAIEKDLSSGLTRLSDLACRTQTGVVRLEVMWRTKTGRAEIANYTLGKLYNYGRAIGLLE